MSTGRADAIIHLEKDCFVLTRTSLIAAIATVGLWGVAPHVYAQALLPYVLPLDYERLEEQGLFLAQDATRLAQRGQFDLAIAQAELAVQLIPGNANAWGLLGSLYLQLEQTDKAISALNRAYELEKDNPTVLFALGTAYFRTGEYNRAADFLEMGLSLEPDNPGALFDLGNTYFKLEQYEVAIARYQRAVDLDSSFWPAINNIGLVRYEQGNVEAAIKSWQAALAISPMEPEPELAISVAQYAQGNNAAALEMGIPALERDSRYADLDFLRENLWGAMLLADTQAFFNLPSVQAILIQL
jgi:tetratricopeptide (TPR) repeat protein